MHVCVCVWMYACMYVCMYIDRDTLKFIDTVCVAYCYNHLVRTWVIVKVLVLHRFLIIHYGFALSVHLSMGSGVIWRMNDVRASIAETMLASTSRRNRLPTL